MSHIHGLIGLMGDARRHMEYLCEGCLGEARDAAGSAWRPPTDVYETEDLIIVRMEVAGLRPGEAEITVEGNVLTARGVRVDRCSVAKLAFHRMEIPYGRFEKRIQINVPFDPAGIEARIDEGFLEVTVPKIDPPEPREVKLSIHV